MEDLSFVATGCVLVSTTIDHRIRIGLLNICGEEFKWWLISAIFVRKGIYL